MKNEIPTHILNHLLNNESFCRRVVPYLKKEYFDNEHKIVFDLITDFVRDHNKLPTSRVLEIEIKKVSAPDELSLDHTILFKKYQLSLISIQNISYVNQKNGAVIKQSMVPS